MKMQQYHISADLIHDIVILNNIYNEYNNQTNKGYNTYQQIYKKYKDKFNSENLKIMDLLSNYPTIHRLIVIGKFYKYNSNNKKLTIPFFYKKNKLYSYGEINHLKYEPLNNNSYLQAHGELYNANLYEMYQELNPNSIIFTFYN